MTNGISKIEYNGEDWRRLGYVFAGGCELAEGEEPDGVSHGREFVCLSWDNQEQAWKRDADGVPFDCGQAL